ncbi:hypothetical protein D3C78_1602810 [compost metagenome]
MPRRHGRQRLKVGVFKRVAPVHVHHEALGDRGQVGARFGQRVQLVAVAQHPHERVLGQIGRIEGIAQFRAQPALQPSVMRTVQKLNGVA